ncbi:MAG: hypothetical protein RI978_736, partial [Verrucomicrobiota bacterium]
AKDLDIDFADGQTQEGIAHAAADE